MQVRKTFEVGGSVGIVIPSKFGIAKDTHMTVERVGKKIMLKRLIK